MKWILSFSRALRGGARGHVLSGRWNRFIDESQRNKKRMSDSENILYQRPVGRKAWIC